MDAIRKALADYATAWVTADADLWLSLWDEGGIQMPPGGPEMDRATLNAVMPAQFVPGNVEAMTVTPQEIVVCGDWAWARCGYEYSTTDAGQVHHSEGKSLSIFRRQPDGGWKFFRDCHNSSGG